MGKRGEELGRQWQIGSGDCRGKDAMRQVELTAMGELTFSSRAVASGSGGRRCCGRGRCGRG